MYDISSSLLGYLIGHHIIVTTIVRQNRTHHKWRINKKWRKRYGVIYIERQDQDIIFANDTFYVTKKGFEMLVKIAEEKENMTWQPEQTINDLKNYETKDIKSIQSRVSTLLNNALIKPISIM